VNPSELVYGSDKIMEAHHLYGVGAVHEKKHELQEAQQSYEEALALYEEIFGTQHPTTGLVTRALARVLLAQGKHAEAALLEDLAADILSRRNDGDTPEPFGGSSGFFSLMGWDNRSEETDPSVAVPLSTDEPKAAGTEGG
jgi:tetratricopeptide (TPR) repeat protein